MIRETLELLRDKDWLIDDMDINIAKGLYEMTETCNELKKKITKCRT